MQVDENVKRLIQAIDSGKFNKYAQSLSGSDFGLYIRAYADGGTIRLLEDGYSQTETNLKITVIKRLETSRDTRIVGWIGRARHNDSECDHNGDSHCRHDGTKSCTHCTPGNHDRGCDHCTGHKNAISSAKGHDPLEDAPELDYDAAIKALQEKRHILDALAQESIGLALIHGHSRNYEFTKLPEAYVSVICDGETSFRPIETVAKDATFVPNMWRVVNGELLVAGGFSGA